MHKILKKDQVIAILRASQTTPKTLWSPTKKDKVVPLFTGGRTIQETPLNAEKEASTEDKVQIKAQISPALLGVRESKSDHEKEATKEERENLTRSKIEEELEEKYRLTIEDLHSEIQKAEQIGHDQGHEAGHQGGYKEGLSEGHAQGHAQGKSETETELGDQLLAHAELVKELKNERDNILRSARSDAIELAIRLAERLVGSRLKKEDYLRSRLQQALEAVSDGIGDPIYIRVAPSLVDTFKAISQRSMSNESDLYIEPDESIKTGDIVVESCGRRVTSVLKEQLERLEEVLYE